MRIFLDQASLHFETRNGQRDSIFYDSNLSALWTGAVTQQDLPPEVSRSHGLELSIKLSEAVPLFERWLSAHEGEELIVESPELHGLPWEWLVDGNELVASRTAFRIIRSTTKNAVSSRAAYKDIRVMFLAAAPDKLQQLKIDEEASAIMRAFRRRSTGQLIVEESGMVKELVRRQERERCEVLHLCCHGEIEEDEPVLLLETREGHVDKVTADRLVGPISHTKLVFLSACQQGGPAGEAKLAQSCLEAGADAVLLWGGPVSDDDAVIFAQNFYEFLGNGDSISTAVARVRQEMIIGHSKNPDTSGDWHKAHLFVRPGGDRPLCDRNAGIVRPRQTIRPPHAIFGSTKGGLQVAGPDVFIGRRRQTQTAVRRLHEVDASPVLLMGMGGSGKSSLAARVADRLTPDYRMALVYRDYEPADFIAALRQVVPREKGGASVTQIALAFKEAEQAISADRSVFGFHLRALLEDYFFDTPVLMIIDDLEQHILSIPQDGEITRVLPPWRETIAAVIEAFRDAGSESRLLLTSRYRFCVDTEDENDPMAQAVTIDVPAMSDDEQERHWKALISTQAVEAVVPPDIVNRIIAVARGNPGLADVLFKPLLSGHVGEATAALEKIEGSFDEAQQSQDVASYLRRLALNVYHDAMGDAGRAIFRSFALLDFPVPRAALIEVAALQSDVPEAVVDRLSMLGLLSEQLGPGIEGYLLVDAVAVAALVTPLEGEERRTVGVAILRALWRIWVQPAFDRIGMPTWNGGSVSGYARNFYTGSKTKVKGSPYDESRLTQETLDTLNQLRDYAWLVAAPKEENIGMPADAFLEMLGKSLSLNALEKMCITVAAMEEGLSSFQYEQFREVFSDEAKKFSDLSKEHPGDIFLLCVDNSINTGVDFSTIYSNIFAISPSDDLLQSFDAYSRSGCSLDGLEALVATWANNDIERSEGYSKIAARYSGAGQLIKAGAMYERAIETDPNNANNLGNYAAFLQGERQDMDAAGSMYERAIEADPNHANALGNYAFFLQEERQDMEAAGSMYERAIDAAPNHVGILGYYARFLGFERKDVEAAVGMYERAIKVDPNHANNLGNYALFLQEERKDMEAAGSMYERAIEADPNHANNLGNYARFLFLQDRGEEAQARLVRAEDLPHHEVDLTLELAFYRYAHCSGATLTPLRMLLEQSARSAGWDFAATAERACADGHPEPDLLRDLAQVCADTAALTTLNRHDAWLNKG